MSLMRRLALWISGMLLAAWVAMPISCVSPLLSCGRACQSNVDCQWGTTNFECKNGICTSSSCNGVEPANENTPEHTQTDEATPRDEAKPPELEATRETSDAGPDQQESIRDRTPEITTTETPSETRVTACPANGEFAVVIRARGKPRYGIYPHLQLYLGSKPKLDDAASKIRNMVFVDGTMRNYVFIVTKQVRPTPNAPCAIRSIGFNVRNNYGGIELEVDSVRIGDDTYYPKGKGLFDPIKLGDDDGAAIPWDQSKIKGPGFLIFNDIKWKPAAPPTSPPPPARPTTKPTLAKELQYRLHKTGLTTNRTPIATIDNQTFATWIDQDGQLLVASSTRGQTGSYTKTKILIPKSELKLPLSAGSHRGASIGVDRNGYIHVVGHMQHAPFDNNRFQSTSKIGALAWRYWVSTKPLDINAFDQIEPDSGRQLPGCSISYPNFFRDRRGLLYITFQHQLGAGTQASKSRSALAIARYDVAKRQWKMVGPNPSQGSSDSCNGDPKTKVATDTFFWKCSAVHCNNTAPQLYRAHIHFDLINRMHVVWGYHDGRLHQDNDSADRFPERWSHVFYAYSNDGNEFIKADGSKHTFPITPDKAEVVFALPPKPNTAKPEFPHIPLWHQLTITTGINRQAIVAFNAHGLDPNKMYQNIDPTKSFSGTFTTARIGGQWSAPAHIKLSPSGSTPKRGKIFADRCGILTAFSHGIYRSANNGKSWLRYPQFAGVNGHLISIDPIALQQYGQYILTAPIWKANVPSLDSYLYQLKHINESCDTRSVFWISQ